MKQKRGRRQEKKETWRQEIRGWYGKPSQFNTTSFRPVPNAARWEAELDEGARPIEFREALQILI